MRTGKRQRPGLSRPNTPPLPSPRPLSLPLLAKHLKMPPNKSLPLHQSRPLDSLPSPNTNPACSRLPQTPLDLRLCRTKDLSPTSPTTSLLGMVSPVFTRRPPRHRRSHTIHSASRSQRRTTRSRRTTITLVKARPRLSLVLSPPPQTTTPPTTLLPSNARNTRTTMEATVSPLRRASRKPVLLSSVLAVHSALDLLTRLIHRVRSHK